MNIVQHFLQVCMFFLIEYRAGGEDDFEIFLANVKARSLAAQSQVKNGKML